MDETTIKIDFEKIEKPISSDNPSGSDPELHPDYINLDAELNKMNGIDYGQVVELSYNVLSTESKHLRVASWLCLGLLKTEGLAGFRKGLQIIFSLLDNFGDSLFPQKPKMQKLAIQSLGSEKRILSTIKNLEITEHNAGDLVKAIEILNEITLLAQKQFAEEPPSFEDLETVLSEISEGAGDLVKGEMDEQAAKSSNSQPEQSEAEEKESSPDSGEPPAEETNEAAEEGETEDKPEEESEKETEVEEPAEKVPIPEIIVDLLKPISDDNPPGEDVDATEDQEIMVEYMSLESEMGKFSGNDYEKCAEDCTHLLSHRTKHLRVAIWLMISWFRTAGLKGFRDGLALVYHLLENFQDSVHPTGDTQRVNTIQLINSDARLKLIEKIEPDEGNAQTFLDISGIFDTLEEMCETVFDEKTPRFSDIAGTLAVKEKEAQQIITRREKQAEAQKQKEQQKTQKSETIAAQPRGDASAPRTSGTTSASSTTTSTGDGEITKERDAERALKKAIEFYFEETSNGDTHRKIPENSWVYGVSRVYRWGNLNAPPDKDGITQFEAPNQPKQNYIQKLVNGKDWDTLIPEIEVNFLKRADFLYWFDAQKYVVEALEATGGDNTAAEDEIKYHLAKLLKRVPGLLKLKFKDKETPFASRETVEWYEDNVLTVLGNGQSREKILPPIMGEDYKPINEMYEKACEELPAKFETNLKMMQDSISGDTRPKGRFLRLLSCANFCYSARQYSIARVLFNELRQKINQYQIVEWEQALCVAVWQSTYLNNSKLLKSDLGDDETPEIKKEQRQLFDHISKYDSILALNLMNREKEEGE